MVRIEIVEGEDLSYYGHGAAECPCLCLCPEYAPGVLGQIYHSLDFAELSESEINSLISIARSHKEKTGHDAYVRVFKRAPSATVVTIKEI